MLEQSCPTGQGYGHLMMVLPIDLLLDRQGALEQKICILVLALRKNKSSQRRTKQQHRGLRRRQHSTNIQQRAMTPPRRRKGRTVKMHGHRGGHAKRIPPVPPTLVPRGSSRLHNLQLVSSLYRMRTRAHLMLEQTCPVVQGYGHLMVVQPIDLLFDRHGSLVQKIRILVLALRKNKSSQRRRKQQQRGLRRRRHSTNTRHLPMPGRAFAPLASSRLAGTVSSQ